MRALCLTWTWIFLLAGLAAGWPGGGIANAQVRLAGDPPAPLQYVGKYGIGADADPSSITQLDIDVMADGQGLPRGSGTAFGGEITYRERCAVCHGETLHGAEGVRGGALIGGRGTLASDGPTKTVESYWPYATSLFDYVRRAMPPDQPGSLPVNQIYGVVAFILFRGGVIGADEVMNTTTLPKIRMPNRAGFANAAGTPEVFIWR